MNSLTGLYRPSLALLTDLYELTMAYGYWKSGVARQEGVFHLFFRHNPFQGGYSIACGLRYVVDLAGDLRFDETDRAYLADLTGNDGRPLFEPDFLEYLRSLEFSCDIDAIPEGTVVFPHEPLLRVQGPMVPCQILESALLNIINFQTLIATKAARVCHATQGSPVLEFGLRRAQGIAAVGFESAGERSPPTEAIRPRRAGPCSPAAGLPIGSDLQHCGLEGAEAWVCNQPAGVDNDLGGCTWLLIGKRLRLGAC